MKSERKIAYTCYEQKTVNSCSYQKIQTNTNIILQKLLHLSHLRVLD